MQTGAGIEEDDVHDVEANKGAQPLANGGAKQPGMNGHIAPASMRRSVPDSRRSLGSSRASQKSMRTSTRGLGGASNQRNASKRSEGLTSIKRDASQKGMVLPFERMNMAFHHIYYSVNLPSVGNPVPHQRRESLPADVIFVASGGSSHADHAVNLSLLT